MPVTDVTSRTVENISQVVENENGDIRKNLETKTNSTIKPITENVNLPSGNTKSPRNLTSTNPSVGLTVQHEMSEERVHPHLGEDFTDPINQIFNTKEIDKNQDEQAIFNKLKEDGVINENGDINFGKLGLGVLEVKKNHIKGRVSMENGKFQVKVNGYLGDGFVKAYGALKDKVGTVAADNGLKNPITLDPAVLGKPSAEDMEVLKRGGQIQYRAVGDDKPPKTLKLVLDPGENGENDGLTVSYKEGDNWKTSKKIPLNVVFDGQELDGKKTEHPLLENWRGKHYFERSEIKKEYERYVPFVPFFDKKISDNTDDTGRIQAQNDLWNAVNEYLRWSVAEDKAMGSFDTSEINEKTQQAISDNSNEQMKGPSKIRAMVKEAKPRKNTDKYKDLLEGAKNLQNALNGLNKILGNEGNDKNENLMKELDTLVQNPEDLNNLDKLIQDLDELSQNPKNIKAEVHVKTKPAKSNFRQELIDKAKKLSNTLSKLTQQVKNDLNNSNVDRLGISEGNTEHLRQYHEGEIEKNNNS